VSETYNELARTLSEEQPTPEPPGLWQRFGPLGSAAMERRGPWMRDYLPATLADLLARVPTALLALPAPRSTAGIGAIQSNRLAGTPNEWPTQAAVRIGDRTFTGDSHFDAVTKAQAVLGDDVAHRLLGQGGSNVAVDGFLTNTGRYVSREEAGRMLDQRNGTNHFTSGWLTGRPKKGLNSLLAEALDNYNLSTGREKWREKP
jgi:hypothetical protein